MKEVKRHAKIGEYIKIVDCDDIACNGYENGDIFKVIDSSINFVCAISENIIVMTMVGAWVIMNMLY